MDNLVSTAWLAEHLRDAGLVVIDATTFMPSSGRDARAEYAAAHIPGARFLDIDELSDHSVSAPHDDANGRSIVISSDGQRVRASQELRTLVRIGVIADHVAETDHPVHLAALELAQHRRERFEIRMYVRDDAELHRAPSRRFPSALP
jgi:rhodanese-related sulfurtransferase